jgi:hypothetical protein
LAWYIPVLTLLTCPDNALSVRLSADSYLPDEQKFKVCWTLEGGLRSKSNGNIIYRKRNHLVHGTMEVPAVENEFSQVHHSLFIY